VYKGDFTMASLNRVMILGNLGRDPELRYTQSQNPVATLNVATTDSRTTPDGQRQDFTEWHRVVVWGKQAENCSKYLTKGQSVFIEGRIQTRSWDDPSGQKRYATEVVAQTVKFLSGGSRSAGGENPAFQSSDAGPQDYPSAPTNNASMPNLDDIPF
jgi:single-strand DNA-binding protein